ncbi:MAG TPA: efflux RND transporter periplasmic adaptor subunit [Burkholderiaceae bacterium]|nr:efflux RND transporter periplasmic adaptor subunit [Burkholderiaceae bacterium]
MRKILVLCAALAAVAAAAADTPAAPAAPLATAPVQAAGAAQGRTFDAVVEAVRQTIVAAQVAGAVTALDVKAGDSVKAGQVLARIDARAALQTAASSQAQVRSAQAMLEVARKEYERQQQLFKKDYISQAALERAESQFKAAQAQAAAQLAQAGAAHTQSGFYVVRAPYAGVVAEVPVAVGDMAMPGRALATIYESGALRVTAAVPQSALGGGTQAGAAKGAKVEFAGLPADRRWLVAPSVQVLPTVDAATHSVTLRIPLPADFEGVAPGSFARIWLPGAGEGATRLAIPASAVVRRAEMTGVYVVDAKGVPQLRQVRLGRAAGDSVEVLAGVSAGERVALDPQAAAQVR